MRVIRGALKGATIIRLITAAVACLVICEVYAALDGCGHKAAERRW